MQSPEYSPVPQHHYTDASRPSLGFPLGTALLLIVVFCLSGIFSCCYHWDKFRNLRERYTEDLEAAANHPTNPINPPNYSKQKQDVTLSVPVIMAGDKLPRFIAMPCPCEPPRLEKFASLPSSPTKPPKTPRLPVHPN